MSVIVIGYGNTLRSDDGFGCYVIERLLEREHLSSIHSIERNNLENEDYPEITLLSLHQLTPELVDTLHQARMVVFIDTNCGNPSGEINRQRVFPADTSLGSSFSHHLTPTILLALCQTLYGHSPESWLFSVGANNFEIGEHLSPLVDAALEPIVEEIEILINNSNLEMDRPLVINQ